MPNDGNATPAFRAGQDLTAEALNQIGRMLISQVKGGKGISVSTFGNRIMIEATAIPTPRGVEAYHFKIGAVFEDYMTCTHVSGDGTEISDKVYNVAKPPIQRGDDTTYAVDDIILAARQVGDVGLAVLGVPVHWEALHAPLAATGDIPTPSDTVPIVVDAIGASGSSSNYRRGDNIPGLKLYLDPGDDSPLSGLNYAAASAGLRITTSAGAGLLIKDLPNAGAEGVLAIDTAIFNDPIVASWDGNDHLNINLEFDDDGGLETGANGLYVEIQTAKGLGYHADGIYVKLGSGLGFDGSGNIEYDGTHNVLSTTHADSSAAAVAEGDLIIGNGTPKWSKLVKGTDDQVLTMVSGGIEWADASGNTYTAGDGLVLSSDEFSVDLATDPGLEFSGGDLRVKIKASAGIGRGADGLYAVWS